MSDHVHLLVNEPNAKPLATAIQVVKQRFSRTRLEAEVWERRYYDFNVRSEDKRLEKLRYIHRNPVTRGLVAKPDQWPWSSFRAYAHHEPGPLKITAPSKPPALIDPNPPLLYPQHMKVSAQYAQEHLLSVADSGEEVEIARRPNKLMSLLALAVWAAKAN